ncbi:MAG: CDP-alcohol phosphatidyltransferase family protein, partial [Candidatus Bipolaricaulota bacterium]
MRHLRFAPSTLLTLSRFATAPLLLLAWRRERWGLAGALFAALVLSDIADGWVARSLAVESAWGRVLDVCADVFAAIFLLVGLAIVGMIPAWTPVGPLVAALGFVAIRVGGRLTYDPVGKHYGAGLFVAIGLLLLPISREGRVAVAAIVAVASGIVLAGRWRYRVRN